MERPLCVYRRWSPDAASARGLNVGYGCKHARTVAGEGVRAAHCSERRPQARRYLNATAGGEV